MMIHWVKTIILGLVFLLIITLCHSWANHSSAQSLFPQSNTRFSLNQSNLRIFSTGGVEFSSVYLDGVPLFSIASLKVDPSDSDPNEHLSLLERRVRRIESRLYNLITTGFDPSTLNVQPSTLNNLTVIVASDQAQLDQQVILTVTEIDAELEPSSVGDVAQKWSEIIKKALLQAYKERQPQARQSQILTTLQIILAMLFVMGLLLWGQKRLRIHLKALKKKAAKQASLSLKSKSFSSFNSSGRLFPRPLAVLGIFRKQANLEQRLTLNLMLQRLMQISLILIFFGALTGILYVFPETRAQGQRLVSIPLKLFTIWLVITLVSNLVSLYVNHRLREWVEEGEILSEDGQRRILRAPTLLEVSRGIIRFLSWTIGLIWFLMWREVFPESLLAGAGLLGAALTFVFQSLLKDWINGILIIFEDHYAVGDIIVFNDLFGIVEYMSLRVTQIRTLDGRLTTIPHNQMTLAHNLARDWSRVNFKVEVAYETNPNDAIFLMKQVAQDMAKDPHWQNDIINPVSLIGVTQVSHSGIQIMLWIQVKRARQIFVDQEFRRRLKIAFDEKGIKIGIPQQSLLLQNESEINKSKNTQIF